MNLPMILGGLSLLAFVKGVQAASKPPIRTIYLLGDSNTAAPDYTNGNEKTSWLAKAVQARTGAKVYAGARGGWGVKQVREKYVPEIQKIKPDVVVAWLGVNDLSSNRSLDHIVNEMKLLKEQVSPSRLVILEIHDWGGYPRGRDKIELTDQANYRLRTEVGVPTIRTDSLGINGKIKPEYDGDGIHFERPSKSVAYDVIGELIMDGLMSI
jgi:hypothetical protein